jgi:catechol 2,3-dioxygenase-like lactoylglutathione lyase family enzyme
VRLNQVTLPAQDIAASAAFYRALGFTQLVAADHYCRFLAPQGDTTLSIHHDARATGASASIYLETETLDADVARLQAAGLVFDTAPVDQTWLWREAWLSDPSGNRICLFHAGVNRIDPPWRLKEQP